VAPFATTAAGHWQISPLHPQVSLRQELGGGRFCWDLFDSADRLRKKIIKINSTIILVFNPPNSIDTYMMY
jgi:hypothetical protein